MLLWKKLFTPGDIPLTSGSFLGRNVVNPYVLYRESENIKSQDSLCAILLEFVDAEDQNCDGDSMANVFFTLNRNFLIHNTILENAYFLDCNRR